MGPAAKFLHLSPGERRLLIKAWLWLGAVRLMLWLMPFKSLQYFLAHAGQRPMAKPAARAIQPERIVWAVEVAGRYIPRATCLPQALSAQALLKRAGFQADLCIGVAREGESQLTGHAWLESRGRVIIGNNEVEKYVPLPALGK